MTALQPAAYAPYADPEDYIMSWTDRIWAPRGMGQIREHYQPDIAVHGAYGTIVGCEPIITACVQKNAAYPRRLFTGEDVIWEARDANSFLSSHRIINCGRQEGHWQYGPPTFAYSTSRNVAVTLVRDAMVAEEWVVRDEWAVVEQSGHDVQRVAREIAGHPHAGLLGQDVDRIAREIANRPLTDPDESTGRLLGNPPADPLVAGVSGRRPERSGAGAGEDQRVLAMIDEVWNQHLGQLVEDYFSRDIVIETTRHRTFARESGYKDELDHLFGAFPDARVDVYDVAFNDDPFFGRRVAVTWVLSGTYSGNPLYGPLTNAPVEILGVSHFQFRGDQIYREWRVYDELAVLAQINRARGDLQ